VRNRSWGNGEEIFKIFWRSKGSKVPFSAPGDRIAHFQGKEINTKKVAETGLKLQGNPQFSKGPSEDSARQKLEKKKINGPFLREDPEYGVNTEKKIRHRNAEEWRHRGGKSFGSDLQKKKTAPKPPHPLLCLQYSGAGKKDKLEKKAGGNRQSH